MIQTRHLNQPIPSAIGEPLDFLSDFEYETLIHNLEEEIQLYLQAELELTGITE